MSWECARQLQVIVTHFDFESSKKRQKGYHQYKCKVKMKNVSCTTGKRHCPVRGLRILRFFGSMLIQNQAHLWMEVNLIFPYHLSVFSQVDTGMHLTFMLNSFAVVIEKCILSCMFWE